MPSCVPQQPQALPTARGSGLGTCDPLCTLQQQHVLAHDVRRCRLQECPSPLQYPWSPHHSDSTNRARREGSWCSLLPHKRCTTPGVSGSRQCSPCVPCLCMVQNHFPWGDAKPIWWCPCDASHADTHADGGWPCVALRTMLPKTHAPLATSRAQPAHAASVTTDAAVNGMQQSKQRHCSRARVPRRGQTQQDTQAHVATQRQPAAP